jgi:hypothetical protein
VWFQENKTELELEFPDLNITDLTKLAMNRYKKLPIDRRPSAKRKIEETEKKESSVSKLAKFGFTAE